MTTEQPPPPACSLHPGATLHKNGKARDGKQQYYCSACLSAARAGKPDPTRVERLARFDERNPDKARARRQAYERKRLARLKEERAARNEVQNSSEIPPSNPLTP